MGVTIDRINEEIKLTNESLAEASFLMEQVDAKRRTTKAVRAWRLNIGRALSRLDRDDIRNISEDDLIAINNLIEQTNEAKEGMIMAIEINDNARAKNVIEDLKDQKDKYKEIEKGLEDKAIGNAQEIREAIRTNTQAIDKDIEKIQTWLEEKEANANKSNDVLQTLKDKISAANSRTY